MDKLSFFNIDTSKTSSSVKDPDSDKTALIIGVAFACSVLVILMIIIIIIMYLRYVLLYCTYYFILFILDFLCSHF